MFPDSNDRVPVLNVALQRQARPKRMVYSNDANEFIGEERLAFEWLRRLDTDQSQMGAARFNVVEDPIVPGHDFDSHGWCSARNAFE